MIKLLLFLFLIGLSYTSLADEVVLSTSISSCPYSEKELELFEHLSERHLVLLKKEAELNAREEILTQKELSMKEKDSDTLIHKNQKSPAQIYAQLPPSKAVKLLDLETPKKAAEILLQLPSATAGLLIDKTEPSRAQLILQQMSELQKP